MTRLAIVSLMKAGCSHNSENTESPPVLYTTMRAILNNDLLLCFLFRFIHYFDVSVSFMCGVTTELRGRALLSILLDGVESRVQILNFFGVWYDQGS